VVKQQPRFADVPQPTLRVLIEAPSEEMAHRTGDGVRQRGEIRIAGEHGCEDV
jgi:hypothetical protein